MNDELKSKALEIITSLQEVAREGAGHLPGMAQDYITYGRVSATLAVVIILAVMGFAVWRIALVLRAIKDGEDDLEPQVVLAGASGIAGFVCFLLSFTAASKALLVWFAPKVWLIKELAGLVK